MDFKRKWRRAELEEQMARAFDWDDYRPEAFGWEKSGLSTRKNLYSLEFGRELYAASIPHKSRHFRED